MKRIKAITIRRILPVILAAAMFLSLLAGCGDGPERASVESEAPTGAPVEDSRGETTLPVGTRDAEDIMISDEELDDIRSTVEMMEESYHYNAEENVTVGSRDWTIYSSPLGREGLTEAEAKFYDRLEELGQRYIATDALNGIQNSNSEWYLTDRVLYGDLGLVREQALNLVRWFLYNNPQYYFFTGATSSNSYYTTLQIYDFVSKGEDRAKVTNELFEKLDGWIQQVDQQAATTYQKELLVNNLLCLENEYEFGEYDQSLYSAVMLGETVCAGFAKAFCAMMNALDVDTTAGLSRNEEENMGHAWNVVRFDDGNFYCVDVCWNNDDESSTGYSNNYLNVGEADSKNSDYARTYHTYQPAFERYIPVIAAVSYTPTAYDADTKKPAATPAPTPSAQPTPSAPSTVDLDSGSYREGGASGGQGDVMSSYWFNFAVDDAYTCASYGGYKPAAGNQLVVVHILMKNTFSKAINMFHTDFKLRWGDTASSAYAWPLSTRESGELWENEIHIDHLLSDDQLPAKYELEVDGRKDGLLIYEVPAKLPDGTDNRSFSLSFKEAFSSDKQGDTYTIDFTPRGTANLNTGAYQKGGATGYLGDVLNTYWFNFTVDDAYTCASYGGYQPAAGNQLLVVHLLMKNTFSRNVKMFDGDFELIWESMGSEASAWPITATVDDAIPIESLLSSDMLPAEYDLSINQTKEGLLVFEVPAPGTNGADNNTYALFFQEHFADDTVGDDYAILITPSAR